MHPAGRATGRASRPISGPAGHGRSVQVALVLAALGVVAACGGPDNQEIATGAAPAEFCDTFWSSIIFAGPDGEEIVYPEPALMQQAAADLRDTGLPEDASSDIRTALGRWAETLEAAGDGTDPYKEFYGADDDAYDGLNAYAIVTCEAVTPGRYGGGGQNEHEAWRSYGATFDEEEDDLVWRMAEWDVDAEEWRDVDTGEPVEIEETPRF